MAIKPNLLTVVLVNLAVSLVSVLALNIFKVPESAMAIYVWLFSITVGLTVANLWACKARVPMWLVGLVVCISAHGVFLYQPMLSGYTVSLSSSPSNYPTIQPGDVVLSRARPSYQRGAFVGYEVSPTQLDRKRILGLPGDTIEICGSQVAVNGYSTRIENGALVTEPRSACHMGARTFELQPEQYFLVGDSDNSLDSRQLGPVPKADIKYHWVLLFRGKDTISLLPDDSFDSLGN